MKARPVVLALLALLALAPNADARFKVREQPVSFLRWNRGTDVNVAARVSKSVASITLDAANTDSTVVINVDDLIPPPITATADAGDTNRVIARLFLTADSSAAGNLTAMTVACHCVGGSTRAPLVEQPHSVSMVSKAYTSMGSKRGYIFPIVQQMTPADELAALALDPSSQGGLLLCPRWRFVFSGITGKMGTVRATLAYYADVP